MTMFEDPNRQAVGLDPIWGDNTRDNVPQASGATAGTPGTWTPAGADVPASVAALQASTIKASPTAAWTTGQYVQTAATGAPGRAYWSGTAWVGGAAP